jgi:hypothetical protein
VGDEAMTTIVKWILIACTALAGLVLIVFLIGAALPQEHTATVRIRLNRPPARVYATLVNVTESTTWRSDLNAVEVISPEGEPLRWRESGKYGTITFTRDDDVPARRIVVRIDDTTQGFGGRWIYELEPTGQGTVLTITEEGEVYSALFRFMSRFVFGHYATLESYARDLGRHFGDDIAIERISGAD